MRLGDRVVDVDRRHQQVAGLDHLVQAMHAGGGLLGDALPVAHDGVPEARTLDGDALEQVLDHLLLVRARGFVDPLAAVLELVALVDQQGDVAAVVDHQLRAEVLVGAAAREAQRVERAVPVLLQRLALPREHRGAGLGDRGGGVVLGREDVARGPAHVGADVLQRLDQHRGLDGHVQRAGHAHAVERLAGGVLLADRHQARHLVLGDVEFLAAEIGQRDVGDLVVTFGREGFSDSIHGVAPIWRVGTRGADSCECLAAIGRGWECLPPSLIPCPRGGPGLQRPSAGWWPASGRIRPAAILSRRAARGH